jgi:hypothetical protein
MKPIFAIALASALAFAQMPAAGQGTIPAPTIPGVYNSLIKSGWHGTVRYTGTPGFSWGPFSSTHLDINADGTNDFSFGVSALSTNNWGWLNISSFGSNQFLVVSNFVLAQPAGGWIGPTAPSGAAWSSGPTAAMIWHSKPFVSLYWTGPLATLGIGYFGVRFQAADGVHYGWVRARMHRGSQLFVGDPPYQAFIPLREVIDWAYERQPNTPIRAGAVSSRMKLHQITFVGTNGLPHTDGEHVSFGSCFLFGNILRYEMHLAGSFTNAELFSISGVSTNARRSFVAFPDLDYPRLNLHFPCDAEVGREVWGGCGDLTTFFGEIRLTPTQIGRLKTGRLGVLVNNGEVLGQIDSDEEEDLIGIVVERERTRADVGRGSMPPPPLLTPIGSYDEIRIGPGFISVPLPPSEH